MFSKVFAAAVALAAGVTVLLATRLGFPISTTHALIGGLVGAGLMASSTGVNGEQLASGFLLPLATSPFLAVAMAGGTYQVLRFMRQWSGISQETCVCVGKDVVGIVPGAPGREQALLAVTLPTLAVDTVPRCEVRYRGTVLMTDPLHAGSQQDSSPSSWGSASPVFVNLTVSGP